MLVQMTPVHILARRAELPEVVAALHRLGRVELTAAAGPEPGPDPGETGTDGAHPDAARTAGLRAERAAAAEAIMGDARRRAGELEAAALAAAESEERRAGELRVATARAAAGRQLLEAHQAVHQQIVDDVRDRLRSVRRLHDYPRILATLIAQALAALPGGTTVRVDPADEALARRLLRAEGSRRGELSVEPSLSCAGGAEVADDSGATATNTVEARLAAAEPVLRTLIGRLLNEDRGVTADKAHGTEAVPP
jgi:vacuolar-type H+-ATPase subunit E/Vma4